MSDDIAAQVQRLNSVVERIPQLTNHATLLKASHQGLQQEITEVVGNSPFAMEVRGDVMFADKMIDDYVQWMKSLTQKLTEFSQRIQQAGSGGGPFG